MLKFVKKHFGIVSSISTSFGGDNIYQHYLLFFSHIGEVCLYLLPSLLFLTVSFKQPSCNALHVVTRGMPLEMKSPL